MGRAARVGAAAGQLAQVEALRWSWGGTHRLGDELDWRACRQRQRRPGDRWLSCRPIRGARQAVRGSCRRGRLRQRPCAVVRP